MIWYRWSMPKCTMCAGACQQRPGHMHVLRTKLTQCSHVKCSDPLTHGSVHFRLVGILTGPHALLQDAVRGDHGEVAQLLITHGGKIFKAAENRLVDLNRSHLAG